MVTVGQAYSRAGGDAMRVLAVDGDAATLVRAIIGTDATLPGDGRYARPREPILRVPVADLDAGADGWRPAPEANRWRPGA